MTQLPLFPFELPRRGVGHWFSLPPLCGWLSYAIREPAPATWQTACGLRYVPSHRVMIARGR